MRQRDTIPAERSVDIRFDDFMADELGTAERLFALAGEPFDESVRNSITAYLDGQPPRQAGPGRDVGADVRSRRGRPAGRFAEVLAAVPELSETSARRRHGRVADVLDDIAFASATRLASMIRRGKLGSLELLDHFLARVGKYNPAVNAIVATNIDDARKRARAADRALKQGKSWGPVSRSADDGEGILQRCRLADDVGTSAFKDRKVEKNALAVDRWLNAGAVVFGKTNIR